jgi:hypothetical protein
MLVEILPLARHFPLQSQIFRNRSPFDLGQYIPLFGVFSGWSLITQAVVESSRRFISQKIFVPSQKAQISQNFVEFVEFCSGVTQKKLVVELLNPKIGSRITPPVDLIVKVQ